MIKQGQVRVYCCGGAAVNVVYPLIEVGHGASDPGYADIEYTVLDTSRSNLLGKDIPEDIFFHVENREKDITDGSGKVKTTNLAAARQAVPEILNMYPPADLNIVVSSASGGSGSVINSLLVTELLSRGKNVVVISIGSSTSAKEIGNTLTTLESYQAIAEKRDRPVVCYYLDNSKATLGHNDNMARTIILLLAAIWSGENLGLDRKDLENLLNYQNVTEYQPGLVGLDICGQGETITVPKGMAVSTVVTMIASNEEDHNPGIPVGYHSYGVFSDSSISRLNVGTPLHLYTVQGYFAPVVKELHQANKAAKEAYAVNPVDKIKVSGNADDDGLVV